ncbi:MAG: hypothetical protein C0469_09365 [Cyanobacteria bacterium DS2.3.42]|nr:hypothetical protein [Cyanobacteria bacterium DS2.3.42]
MGRLTTASNQTEECEIRATLLSDTFEDESHSRPSSHSSQLVLQCPDCRAETFLGDQFCQECGSTQPAFVNNKAPISPAAVKTLLASRKKLLVASCALLFGVWSVTAIVFASNLPGELDRTISQNRLNDATALAERLFLSRFGALSGRDAESYSEAFYRRAQIFAKNRNFKLALGDLTKVLPSYSRSAEVAQLKASYQLFLSQGNLAVEPSPAATKEAPSVFHQTKSNDISVPAVGKTPARSRMQAVVSPTAKSEATDTAESTELQPVDVANSDKEEVNSEEVDMAAYNRHLAEYFSRTESKNSKGLPVKEPPSFSEWVQSGKAEF